MGTASKLDRGRKARGRAMEVVVAPGSVTLCDMSHQVTCHLW